MIDSGGNAYCTARGRIVSEMVHDSLSLFFFFSFSSFCIRPEQTPFIAHQPDFIPTPT